MHTIEPAICACNPTRFPIAQVEFLSVEMLQKARVLAAPPSLLAQPKRHSIEFGAVSQELVIVFQSKFLVICNMYRTDDFKCAYVFRGKQEVYSPPLRMREIELYETWNHGDSSDWMCANPTQRGLERMEEQLQRRIDIMQARFTAPHRGNRALCAHICDSVHCAAHAQGDTPRRSSEIVSSVPDEPHAPCVHLQRVTQDGDMLTHHGCQPPLSQGEHQV